jgi:hypothetical protein
MHARRDATDAKVRMLIEPLVREGRSEQEISSAVRRALSDGGFAVRARRLRGRV